MGFWSYVFGVGAPPSVKHTPHNLSKEEIEQVVSRAHIHTLDAHEQQIIWHALDTGRHGDGKISLDQIDIILRHLEHEKQISNNDREGVMQAFQEYFKK